MTTISWLDACVAPLLLVATLVLSPLPHYLLTRWAQSDSTKHRRDTRTADDATDDGIEEASEAALGFIVPAQIHHARMLPRDSRHAFRYPALYYAFELHALERRQLDRTAAFAWTGETLYSADAPSEEERHSKRSITKFHPCNFGRSTFPDASADTADVLSGSMLLKLMYELRFRGYISAGPQDVDAERLRHGGASPWQSEVGQVWAIAMPTVFGLAGFNPLTVYYVYRPADAGEAHSSARGPLWLCVLEVHNTFNERHIYVCEVGNGEDSSTTGTGIVRETVRAGYDHSWTFARDFHVSPFNDRSGYYRLFLRDMWRPDDATRIPTIDVRLLLLTPATSTSESSATPPALEKKLLATLSSSQASSATARPKRAAQAISTASVLSALSQQPFDLFLPVARIMKEAAKLHWKRKLPVYIRPEPSGDAMKQVAVDVTRPFDGVGWPVVHNPAEGSLEKGKDHSSGGIFWNDETLMEQACRKTVETYLKRRTKGTQTPVCIRVNSPQAADVIFSRGERKLAGDERVDKTGGLTLYAMSATLFTDLCLYVPSHALLFGSRVERGWGVSSVAAFQDAFSNASANDTPSTSVRFTRYLRSSYMRWAVNEALRDGSIDVTNADRIGARLVHEARAQHPFDSVGYPVGVMLALAAHIAILQLTVAASNLLRVRYVRRPWAQVSEGMAVLASQT